MPHNLQQRIHSFYQTQDANLLLEKQLALFICEFFEQHEDAHWFCALCVVLHREAQQAHSFINSETTYALSVDYLQSLDKQNFDNPPPQEQWQAILLKSELVQSITFAQESLQNEAFNKPVLFVEGLQRFCLQKHFINELRISKNVLVRLQLTAQPTFAAIASDFLDSDQFNAYEKSLNANFSVIYGGPGSGKTSTIFHILNTCLQQTQAENASETIEQPRSFKVALAAFTGKAAMRINQSLQAQAKNHAAFADIKAQTLHRLLGYSPEYGFKYSKERLQGLDLLIVDEASMLDSYLLHELLAACPMKCRIILLGDAQQLPAIELGGFLHSLIHAQTALPQLQVYIHPLNQQHRFNKESSLATVLKQLQASDTHTTSQATLESSLNSATTGTQENFVFIDWQTEESNQQMAHIKQALDEYLVTINSETSIAEKLNAFYNWQVLCAFKEGDYGTHQINTLLDDYAIQKLATPTKTFQGQTIYTGKAIMIERNDYQLGLFNGDIGICLPNHEGKLIVHFDTQQGIQSFPINQLPQFTSCFAMSIHKSQGSEFKNVWVMIPAEQTPKQAALISRALVFTALSRAQNRAILIANVSQIHDLPYSDIDNQVQFKEILACLTGQTL